LLNDAPFFLACERIFVAADRIYSTDRHISVSSEQSLLSGQAGAVIAGEILFTDDYPPRHR